MNNDARWRVAGWQNARTVRGFPASKWTVGRDATAHISFGPVSEHVRPAEWRKPYYFDLEVIPECHWRGDRVTCGLIVHVERACDTEAEARAWAEWFAACVVETGIAGIVAWNARTGGRLS